MPEASAHRDPSRDVVPLVAAMAVAWWTTVRPAGFFPGAAWPQRATAALAIIGVLAATYTLLRGARHLVAVVFAGFLFPCTIAWLIGPEGATALADPVEVFVGAIAWTTLGVLLIRPSAVSIPRGSEGGGGPTIGATDDVARMAIKELDAALVKEEPPPKLVPRATMPRWASLPLYLGATLAGAVALQIVRVGSNLPDRAVLARMVGAACAIALLSTAGDLVEVRYQPRREAKPRTRFQRATRAIVGLAILAFIYFLVIGRER